MASPVLSLELNELCPALLDRWTADGTLPNFAALRDRSELFTTLADVDSPDRLEPWIQWYSIHTGLPFARHGVFHLTDGLRAEHEDIWRLLIAAGRRAFSFASMNVRPFAAPGSLYVADPWCEEGRSFPPALDAYSRFVAHHVREYSNQGRCLSTREQSAFLRFVLTRGLSPRTVLAILRQLASERRNPHLSWRRVALLDALQYDVFAYHYRRLRPDFATFFVNSVAHLQHGYWRHMEPEAFSVKPDPEERERYGDAIRYGYRALDRLVGRFLRLADRTGATIVFQTALSQQPFTRYEDRGGQHFHRLRDLDGFLARCGIAPDGAKPTMTNEYMLVFADEAGRQAARERLAAFALDDGRPAFAFGRNDRARTLYFAPAISWAADPELAIVDGAGGERLRLGDLLYPIDGVKSGCHHPEGALWIRTGRHLRHDEPVSILDIFPTLLGLLGVDSPASARPGRDLLGEGMRRAA